MSHRRILVAVAIAAVSLGGAAQAREGERERTLAERMKAQAALYASLPRAVRAALSGGTRAAFEAASRWPAIESRFHEGPAPETSARPAPEAADATQPAGFVSDPAQDLAGKSPRTGFSQAGSSTAWCGKRVVVGFQDSGSWFESAGAGGAFSALGYAVSTDAGRTYRDHGFMPAGPSATDFLIADPIVACVDASTFYYAGLLNGSAGRAVALFKSTDGGETWSDPVVAAVSATSNVFPDAESLAIDPADADTLYLSYVVFDGSGQTCSHERSVLSLVESTDGGRSWSTPAALDEECLSEDGTGNLLRGSQVVVDAQGLADVAWASTDADGAHAEIRFRRFPVDGSWRRAADVFPPGLNGILQGLTQATIAPSLAIDRRPKAGGTLYLAWSDGRRNQVQDVFGAYGYSDVLLSRSTDGGRSWSRGPVRVNTNLEPTHASLGTDQYMPAIAVDQTGAVGACWYDRRNDPSNFLIDRYCGRSTNGGASWSNLRKTTASFPATIGQDGFWNSFDGYDTIASDALRLTPGFRGAYTDDARGNPDVKSTSF